MIFVVCQFLLYQHLSSPPISASWLIFRKLFASQPHKVHCTFHSPHVWPGTKFGEIFSGAYLSWLNFVAKLIRIL